LISTTSKSEFPESTCYSSKSASEASSSSSNTAGNFAKRQPPPPDLGFFFLPHSAASVSLLHHHIGLLQVREDHAAGGRGLGSSSSNTAGNFATRQPPPSPVLGFFFSPHSATFGSLRITASDFFRFARIEPPEVGFSGSDSGDAYTESRKVHRVQIYPRLLDRLIHGPN
jgi:hypothetical protein